MKIAMARALLLASAVVTTSAMDDLDGPGVPELGSVEQSAKLAPVSVTADRALGANTPNMVTDGNINTYWSAGQLPPQSIYIDLGKQYNLTQIKLQTIQYPVTGDTTHIIYSGASLSFMKPLGGFHKRTTDGDILVLATNAKNVRYLHVKTTRSNSWVGWREIEVYGVNTTQTTDTACPGRPGGGSARHFGYFNGDVVYGDYTSEYQDHGNLAWTGVAAWLPWEDGPNGDVTDDVDLIDAAHSRGMKSMVQLHGIFFDGAYELLPNYKQNWAVYKAGIAPVIGKIAAFVPVDEPYTQYGDPHDENPNDRISAADEGTTPAEVARMKGWLQLVSAEIKASFPNKPIAVIFNGNSITSTMPVPTGYDWVGFDCYGSWDNCQGHSIPWYHSTLKARLTSGQKMIVVPDSGVPGAGLPTLDAQLVALERAHRYYQLAANDPRVVAVIPFLWQKFEAGPSDYWGVRELSQYNKEKWRHIGSCLSFKY